MSVYCCLPCTIAKDEGREYNLNECSRRAHYEYGFNNHTHYKYDMFDNIRINNTIQNIKTIDQQILELKRIIKMKKREKGA